VGFVVALVVLVLIVSAIRSSAGTIGQYNKLVTRGVPARGILLQVASTSLGTAGTMTQRYQRRQVTIDVEVPGRPPVEVRAIPFIPMNLVRDVVPGATVELRVDPRDPSKLAIVGPGVGFFGASLLGAPDPSNRST
jgi:hypothetical protein